MTTHVHEGRPAGFLNVHEQQTWNLMRRLLVDLTPVNERQGYPLPALRLLFTAEHPGVDIVEFDRVLGEAVNRGWLTREEGALGNVALTAAR
jgi:hypothetical protein